MLLFAQEWGKIAYQLYKKRANTIDLYQLLVGNVLNFSLLQGF
jgi:hypothetical protein